MMNGTLIEEICEKVSKGETSESQAFQMLEQLSSYSYQTEDTPALETVYKEKFIYNEPCLRDHLIFNQQVLLGVTHCSIAIEAFKKIYSAIKLYGLRQFAFFEPIIFSEADEAEIVVNIENKGSHYSFEIYYQTNKSGLSGLAAKGNYLTEKHATGRAINIDQCIASATHILNIAQIYQPTNPVVHLGSLHTLQKLYVSSEGNLGHLTLTDDIKNSTQDYFLHPALIDGACTCSFKSNPQIANEPYVPFFIKEIILSDVAIPSTSYCHTRVTQTTHDMVIADMHFCDQNGQFLASMVGFTFKKIDQENFFKNYPFKSTLSKLSSKIDSALIPKEDTAMADTYNLIKTYLLTKLEKLLLIDLGTIDSQLNFIELGLDSVQLMNLAREIEAEVNIELYPTLFFEYENVEALIQYFISEYKEQFDIYLQPELVNVKTKPDIRQAVETSFSTNIPSHLATSNTNATFNQPEIVTPISARDPIAQKHGYLTQQVNKEEQLHDIAVIGMSGRFPKSQNLEEFSEHLLKGTDLIEEIPLSHWDYKPWFEPNGKLENKIYTKWGSFITDVDKFDAKFFNISEQEAQAMDPQIRLLLEVLYATADDAGYTSMIRGSETGIYVGSSFQDYVYCLLKAQHSSIAYSTVGNAITMLANRASFYFNLHGPSLTLDTACSSSLVALHLACQALKNGECKTAFVAGANLILSPYHYLTFCSLDALSATGRCHTFDASADGYIPAEAIVAVLLKPLAKALEDGDQIHAVIKGSAVAHGGHASAITAPSVTQEKAVMLKAWADAKIDPRTINYMEAHGTGTKLGDPIEMEAVKKAFGEHTTDTGFCAIGSLKAHMGHAEPAAGIASLVKVILALKAKKIPMMPNFKTLNPYINLEKSPVYINKEVEEWKRSGNHPRRAGINAFGFGGTYAHVVIEEFSEPDTQNVVQQTTMMQKLILLSAQNEAVLRQYAVNLKNDLLNKMGVLNNENEAEILLKNIAYTLQIGRESMGYRAAFIVDSLNDLAEKLGQFAEQNSEIDDVLLGKPSEEKLNLVLSGRAGEIYLTTILQEKDISALAHLWVLGAQIDWRLLYSQHRRPKKISLPTYPFAKKRYWYEPETPTMENFVDDLAHKKMDCLVEQYSKNTQINAEDFLNTAFDKPKKIHKNGIKKWLHAELKKLTQLEEDHIDPDRLFEEFGINSIDIIALYGRLSQFLRWRIPPGAFQDARTINSLAKYALAAKQSSFQDQMEKIKILTAS